VDALAGMKFGRPEVIEEDKRTDHAPVDVGKRAADREMADIDAARHHDEFDGIGSARVAGCRILAGKEAHTGYSLQDFSRSQSASVHIERFSPGRLAGSVERDLLHPRFGLTQQLLAAAFERLAALVDGNRFLERDLALFEPLDDGLKLLD